MPESDLDALLKLGGDIDGVHKVRVYGRIGQMALEYDEPRRASVLDALGALDAQPLPTQRQANVMQLEPRKHKLVNGSCHTYRCPLRTSLVLADASACGVCRGRLHGIFARCPS